MPFEVRNYLYQMTRKLYLDRSEKDEILKELEGHLEDKAAELKLQGLDPQTAMVRAVEEMGAPGAVAQGLHEVHSPGVWRDVMLSTIPHFLLAALFALHLWSHYFLVSLLLIAIAFVTWRNWRAGSPSKWSYSWMGYSLAAPALSWLLSLITIGYGAWTLLTTGQLPFNVVLFFLLIGYVPFSMWIMASVLFKMIERDWLLASLTALPFPFLTSWILFLNWQGGLWSNHAERMQDSDTARAFIFVAMALTTAVFLRLSPRLLRIGLLTVSTSILVVITAASLPVSLDVLAVVLMIVASLAFLLCPAMLESRLEHRRFTDGTLSETSDTWPSDDGYSSP
jgi:hypothetical protein